MFCIAAFIVLAIMGIFSASNRQLAGEALDCVLRRVTLRPCTTGFDEKMKARLLGVVIVRSERAAILLNKNFELLAWIFLILTLASGFYSVRGLYLFYTTGSCNGANDTGFCVFDPTGANNEVSSVGTGCSVAQVTGKGLTLKDVDLSGMAVENPEAADQIVFLGCYACDYSRKAYPEVRALAQQYKASFTLAEYPVKEKSGQDARVAYCVRQQSQDAYWKLSDILFTTDTANLDNFSFLQKAMLEVGIDSIRANACLIDPKTDLAISKQQAELRKTGFYGTPTVFINGEALVGPKPYRVYAIQLKGLFYFLR
jgi:protein-disulfide isomerase